MEPDAGTLLGAAGVATLAGSISKAFEGTIPGLTKVTNASNALANSFASLGGMTEAEIAAMKTFAASLSDPAKGIEALTDKLKDNVKNFQDLNKEIIQAGRGEGSQAFIEKTRQQSYEVANLGISMKTLITANKELLASYDGSLKGSEKQTQRFEENRNAMALLIGFNDKFAISQKNSTDILNVFNNTLGGGTQAAQSLSDKLIIFSQETGQSANKVFGQFNEQIDRFAVLGAEGAVKAFEKIQLSAARTGQSIGGVVSMVSKFDDIEEGFKAGGQLNRVLSFMGGSFDTFKAMQSSDEERAKMMYDAITGVSQKYSEMSTDIGKRNMAKQLVESTGMDMKTVLGLLNKTSDLSADMAEIAKKPAITDEFTKAGREDVAAKLTTASEWGEVRKQMLDFGPLTTKLSEVMTANSRALTLMSTDLIPKFEKASVDMINNAKTSNEFLAAASGFVNQIAGIPEAFKNAQGRAESDKSRMDLIITGNTVTHNEVLKHVKHLNENGVKSVVEVKIDSTGVPVGTKVTAKQIPNMDSVISSFPSGYGVNK